MSFPCSPSEYCAVCISASILPSTLREGTKSKKIAHKRRRRLFFRFLNLKFFALFSAKTCTFETLNHDFETNVPNRLCPPLERYGKRHQWSPNKPKNVKRIFPHTYNTHTESRQHVYHHVHENCRAGTFSFTYQPARCHRRLGFLS